jgi:ACS family hexuronate transporter-like MFS transporter
MSQGINNTEGVATKSRRIVKNLRWWVLVLFLLGVTVNYITRNSLGILAPELKTSMGITTEQYSWIVGAFQLAYTLFQPLCGWLIDVIGLKIGFLTLHHGGLRSGSHACQRQNAGRVVPEI